MLPRLSVLLPGLLAATVAWAQPALGPEMVLYPATYERFRYEGRFDRTDPREPLVIWSGSRISLDFESERLVLPFGRAEGESVFNVTVDGQTELVDIRAPGVSFTWPHPLAPGRHHLELFKRSEAAKGHVGFYGVFLMPKSRTWAPPAPAYKLKMEFFGDSITAGACNEDGATDQWDDFRTHNYALSWAHLTATALHADDRAMAYSGMGIVTGWEPVKAGEIWDKVQPRPDSPRADLAAWQPEVAFINLGENDDSYTFAKQLPFPPGFTADYVALVKAIRVAYPRAQIVLLRGGMQGGAQSENLRAAWESAVKEVEAADPRISHYVFTHWSKLHPRVSDDRAMADELTAWLKTQAFMASCL